MPNDNVKTYAEALFALHQAKLLKNEQCKKPVKLFIRLATEPLNNPHSTCHYRSKAAAQKIAEAIEAGCIKSPSQYHKFCSKGLSHDHIVPVEVIYRMIQEEKRISKEWLHDALRNYGQRATITKDENDQLVAKGLNSKMPEEFFDPTSKRYYMNPLARYIKINIHKGLEQRDGEGWTSA